MGFGSIVKKVTGGAVGSAIGGAVMGPIGNVIGGLAGSGNLNFSGLHRPDAPNLPPAPTLTAAQLAQYPGMTPEQVAILQQQQQYMQQGGNAAGNIGNAAQGYTGIANNLGGVAGQVGNLAQGYGQGGYFDQSNAANMQAIQNYQNALRGQIAPNQMIAQQKQADFEKLKQSAGQRGIQITGNTPETAVSQSTSGNQVLLDFNKRYGALEQNYNLGQQQFGLQAQSMGLGQQNQQYQNQLQGFNQQANILGQQGQQLNNQVGAYGQQGNAYANLANQGQQMYGNYDAQRLGQYNATNQQALMNTDISNQNLMNQYQQMTGQTLANYNNSLAGYNANMGLLQSGLGLAGQLGSAFITRGASLAGGGGGAQPQAPVSSGMGMNFGTNYYQPQQPSFLGTPIR